MRVQSRRRRRVPSVGVPAAGQPVEFLPAATYLDVSIMGCRYGTARPFADVRRITDFYLAGKLMLDELVTLGNRMFGERYLFAGDQVDSAPFERVGYCVSYSGDDGFSSVEVAQGVFA